MTYQNLVPETAVQAVALQVLGQRLYQWSEITSPKLCENFSRRLSDLDEAGNRIREELNELLLDEFEVPLNSEGDPIMTRLEYRRDREASLDRRNADNIASLDKLTTIYLKLTAGGLGAMLSGMKQSAMLQQQEKDSQGERNVTPRRRYGAGLAQVESD